VLMLGDGRDTQRTFDCHALGVVVTAHLAAAPRAGAPSTRRNAICSERKRGESCDECVLEVSGGVVAYV
jgi:hypothetical protein